VLPADLAALLRPGDVLLVGRSGAVSDAIREVTTSLWSHVAMVDQSVSGAWVVLEATHDGIVDGVAARKLETITDDPTVEHLSVRRLVDVPGLKARAVPAHLSAVQAMWFETGEPYSNRVNVDILLHIPVTAADGVNCDAAVNDAYTAGAGVQLHDPRVPTPEAMSQSTLLQEIWRRDVTPVVKTPPPAVDSSAEVQLNTTTSVTAGQWGGMNS